MTKVETVCPYFKKQIVVERNHFGVGEQASAYKTLRGVHFFAPKTAAARRGALLCKSRGKREAACGRQATKSNRLRIFQWPTQWPECCCSGSRR